MELDFSKLDTITYRSAKSAQERRDRDTLLAEGYTFVEGKTPFDEPQLDTSKNASKMPINSLEAPGLPTTHREHENAL